MSTEFSDTATAVEEVAVGAAQAAAEVASDPMGAARKQARSFGRKGTPAVRRFNRRLNALIPPKVTILGVEVNDRLPEKLVIKGLHLVKVQARRQDMVGDVAKRTLRIFNGLVQDDRQDGDRLEQASDLTPAASATRSTSAQATPLDANRPPPRRNCPRLPAVIAPSPAGERGRERGPGRGPTPPAVPRTKPARLFGVAFGLGVITGSLHRVDRVRLHP
jgi:hypothetical protein